MHVGASEPRSLHITWPVRVSSIPLPSGEYRIDWDLLWILHKIQLLTNNIKYKNKLILNIKASIIFIFFFFLFCCFLLLVHQSISTDCDDETVKFVVREYCWIYYSTNYASIFKIFKFMNTYLKHVYVFQYKNQLSIVSCFQNFYGFLWNFTSKLILSEYVLNIFLLPLTIYLHFHLICNAI